MAFDPKRSTSQSLQLTLFILASVLVGLFAVFYGQVFRAGEEQAEAMLLNHPNALLVVCPLFFFAASAVCRFFAPEAAGGGIDTVRRSLRELSSGDRVSDEKLRRGLGLRTLIVKFVSSIFMITGGGALGREGPVVQMTAGIFSTVGRRSRRLFPDLDIRAWIIAGSAAGVAAAFNTPLGGLVFALEEVTELHVSTFRGPLFLAVVTAGLTALAISGPYLLFPAQTVHWKSGPIGILCVIAIGIAAGVFVAAFQKLSREVHKKLIRSQTQTFWIVPVLCGLMIAFIARSMGPEVIGGGIKSAQMLVSRPASETDSFIFPAHMLTLVLSLASGAAGGILAPGLSLGAQMGALLSKFLGTAVDPTLLILGSMAAYLGALVNAPFTAAVLTMEMTNQHDLIFPLLIASLVSVQTANFLKKNALFAQGSGS